MLNKLFALFPRLREELGQAFRSLRNPNYLRYSIGQLISLIGTNMQNVAMAWLVYQMTGSALLLGTVSLASNGPVLLLSLFGGMVADRLDRRKVLIVTQWAELAFAGILTALVFTNVLQVWMILVLSVLQGIAVAFETPCRQAFVADIVEGQDMVNVVSINSSIMNMTRLVGPAVGAALLALFGAGICFLLNSASYLAAIYTLQTITTKPAARADKGKSSGTLADALKLVLVTPAIRNVLIITVAMGFFGLQVMALLPVFASSVLHGNESTFGYLTAATAAGSLIGSLLIASRGKASDLTKAAGWFALALAVALAGFSMSANLIMSLVALVFCGFCISMQMNSSNTILQLAVNDQYRGRVMAVYTMVVFGAVPMGTLAFGWVTDLIGAPHAVLICAAVTGLAGLFYTTRKEK